MTMLSNNLDITYKIKINTYCPCSTNHSYKIYVTIDFGRKMCKFEGVIQLYFV